MYTYYTYSQLAAKREEKETKIIPRICTRYARTKPCADAEIGHTIDAPR